MTTSGQIISRMIPFNGVPEIPAVIKSSIPKGGVERPTIILKVTTMPKWIILIPKVLATGIRIGTKTNCMVDVSMNIPRIRMNTLTRIRNVALLVVMFKIQFAIFAASCSLATI